MKRYFITGTDTDCGKTYVTKKLLEFFADSAAIKPIASGCILQGGQLVNADALQLKQNNKLTLEQINPWRFPLPVSPHIAARQTGAHIKIDEIARYCLELQIDDTEILFIEGAGGLMVPLNEQETWIDFLKITQLPVLLVVGMKLGCINHALLTAKVLETCQIHCNGWIANCLDPDMIALKENIATLKLKLNVPLLGTLPFQGGFSLINLP